MTLLGILAFKFLSSRVCKVNEREIIQIKKKDKKQSAQAKESIVNANIHYFVFINNRERQN